MNFYISLHSFVANFLFRCSKMCMVWNNTKLPPFFYLIICLQKLKIKQFLLGISRLNQVDCWKLEIENWKPTEIKLAKNDSRHQATQGVSGEKREREIWEHCRLMVKNAANRLICFYNQVVLHLEEVNMDNKWWLDIFIVERLALMI